MLHKQVMRDEGVFAKLNLHRDPILHEVGLIVGPYRRVSCILDCLLLFLLRQPMNPTQ